MTPRKRRGRIVQTGFTLVEILIALTIMAMIGLMANQLLVNVTSAREQFDEHVDEMRSLARASIRLERDLRQVVARPIRDEYGDARPALTLADGQLEFSRSGWRNPTGVRRASLQRVAYRIDGEARTLVRRHWPVMDRAVDTPMHEAVLLRDVGLVEFAVIDAAGAPHLAWPDEDYRPRATPTAAESAAPDAANDAENLPIGIEVTFELDGIGPVRRVFDIAFAPHEAFTPEPEPPDCDPSVDPDCPGFVEPTDRDDDAQNPFGPTDATQ